MSGREKIEAALGETGTPEIPAVICYEGIYIRDHWNELVPYPWWYQFAPDIESQMRWRAEVVRKTGQDWFRLPFALSTEERKKLVLKTEPEGVFLFDSVSGLKIEGLRKPEIGGWFEKGRVQSVQPLKLAETHEEIDAAIPLPEGPAQGILRAGEADLASLLLGEAGRELYPHLPHWLSLVAVLWIMGF